MINDVKNLKENGSASLDELREFLKTLKARSPQEVIGIVKTSLLIQSLAISTVATVALLAAFTVGPYMVYGPKKPATPTAKPAAVASTPEASKPAEPTAAAGTTPATPAAGAPDAEKAAKVMGLDETKPADPKKNPLDKPDLDKLLDGV
ncbi:MAG: hypothetical protein U0941_18060 [Planctomycetaceae bacterium]